MGLLGVSGASVRDSALILDSRSSAPSKEEHPLLFLIESASTRFSKRLSQRKDDIATSRYMHDGELVNCESAMKTKFR